MVKPRAAWRDACALSQAAWHARPSASSSSWTAHFWVLTGQHQVAAMQVQNRCTAPQTERLVAYVP